MYRFVSLLLPAAALALISGCGTTSDYVDASDTTVAVKNANRMSSSDWVVITEQAGRALLTSPQFDEYLAAYRIDAEKALQEAEQSGTAVSARERLNALKPLLMLSTIQNNTAEHIDSRLLTERLREVLFNSGKVRFTTYAAGEGQTIDPATGAVRQLQYDPNVNQRTVAQKGKVNAYDLSLSGAIIKQTASSGRDRELSYTFTLTLTDNVTGEGVWAYTREIKRQNKQDIFGY